MQIDNCHTQLPQLIITYASAPTTAATSPAAAATAINTLLPDATAWPARKALPVHGALLHVGHGDWYLAQEEEMDTFPYGSRSNPLPYGS